MTVLEVVDQIAAGKTADQRALIAAELIPKIQEHRRRVREFAQVPPISCVYFLRDAEGFIKIGWTKNLRKRVAALQVISSAPLRLLGVVAGERDMEQWLHRMLSADRVRGEWFRQSPRLELYLTGEGFIP